MGGESQRGELETREAEARGQKVEERCETVVFVCTLAKEVYFWASIIQENGYV